MKAIRTGMDQLIRVARSNLRRGSLLWKVAATANRFCKALHYRNPLNLAIWEKNTHRFESEIQALESVHKEFWFIQIGACDGSTDDPIREYVKRSNWRGVLIEPQRYEFERLKLTYAAEGDRLVFENVAIADQAGERLLYRVKEECIQAEWQRGIASFLPLKDIHDPSMIMTETVRCVTLEDVLRRNRIEHVDLLQIDVEGYDYEILKLARLDRFKPKLIRYEHKHLSLQDTAECRAYLRRNGYEILPMQLDTGAVLL